MTKFLNSAEDLTWLNEVHNVSTAGYVCAVLHGNEDAPDKVEVFARNHRNCNPIVYIADENGDLSLESYGEKPKA